MGITVTYPSDWYDHQTRYCHACSNNAKMKIEVRVEVNDVVYGPAQILRLCNEHLLELVDVMYEELHPKRKWFWSK
jgi:hypothetical protein